MEYLSISEDTSLNVELIPHYCKGCGKLIGVDKPIKIRAILQPIRAYPFHMCPNCESIYCSVKCMKPVIDFTYADKHQIRHKLIRNECKIYLEDSIIDNRDDCGCLNHITPNDNILNSLRCRKCATPK